MELLQAMKERNSVRQYVDKKIPDEIVAQLREEIEACNKESGLHIQMVTNDTEAFGGMMARYGKFDGVQNYIALIGKKGDNLDEVIGYYGERVVLKAQQLGLNTCWVAMTVSKRKCKVVMEKNEKMPCVLSLGYGKTQGKPHKNKPESELFSYEGEMPEWFKKGMEATMFAPTAMNQQKFLIEGKGDHVTAKITGGYNSKIDLGIVKYHFEVGSGRKIM